MGALVLVPTHHASARRFSEAIRCVVLLHVVRLVPQLRRGALLIERAHILRRRRTNTSTTHKQNEWFRRAALVWVALKKKEIDPANWQSDTVKLFPIVSRSTLCSWLSMKATNYACVRKWLPLVKKMTFAEVLRQLSEYRGALQVR